MQKEILFALKAFKKQSMPAPKTAEAPLLYDCCRFVTVSDCIINTGDDAIAIRCDSEKLKNPKPCEYVTITNCVLASNSSVFRLGVGTGEIRRVRVSNLAISRAGNIVTFSTSWAGIGNAKIEDVSFSDITADNVCRMLACAVEIGSVKNAVIKNVNAVTKGGIYVSAQTAESVSELTFKNIDFTVIGKRVLNEKYLINVSNTNGVTFDSVNAFYKNEEWERAFNSENNVSLNLKNCNF